MIFIAAASSSGTSVYRYDGPTGRLNSVERLGASAAIQRVTFTGVQFGLDCAATGQCTSAASTVAWDGSLLNAACVGDLSKLGACVVVGPRSGVWVAGPGDVAAHQILPADWGALDAVWSPDGAHLLLLRLTGTGPDALWVMELDGRLRKLVEITGLLPGALADGATAIGWSPDGHYATFQQLSPPLHFGTYELMTLTDLASGQRIQVGPALSGDFTWSRDGRLAFVDAVGGMAIWNGKDRHSVGSVPPDRRAHLPVWDAAGNKLAWVELLQGAVVFDGRERTEFECPNGNAVGIRWSREGDALLVACGGAERGDLWLWRLGGSGDRMLPLVRNIEAQGMTFAWSRDAAIP